MKKFIYIFLIIGSVAFGAQNIKVGAYLFPPYVNISNNVASGKTVELIKALNNIQNKYKSDVTISDTYILWGIWYWLHIRILPHLLFQHVQNPFRFHGASTPNRRSSISKQMDSRT
jgi:hypothetical protein